MTTALPRSIGLALWLATGLIAQTTKPAAPPPDPATLGLFVDQVRVPAESGRRIVVPCSARPGSTHRIELAQRSMQRYEGPLLSFDFERPLSFDESTRSATHVVSISYDPDIMIEWIESSPAEGRSRIAQRRELFEKNEFGVRGVFSKATRKIDGIEFEGATIAVTRENSTLECFEYMTVVGRRAIHLIYGYPTALKATWGPTFERLIQSVRIGDQQALAALAMPSPHGTRRPHYDIRFDETPKGVIADRPLEAPCGHVKGKRHELWLSTAMPVIDDPEFFASEECSFSRDADSKVKRDPPRNGDAAIHVEQTVGFGESFRIDVYFWAAGDVGDGYLDNEAIPAERRSIEARRATPLLPSPEPKDFGMVRLLGRAIAYNFQGEERELWIGALQRGEGAVYFRVDMVAKPSAAGRRAVERVLSTFRLPGEPGFGTRLDAESTSRPTSRPKK